MPQSWAVEEKIDGKWQVVADGSKDYIHALVELNGQNRFRIVENSGITTRLKLNEVFVFGAGDLPDWVQRWEPTVEKADLLVLATHPDDELIFFGGTIPTYAVEQKKNVVVAYMSYATAARRSELLNGLWHMGVRNYPGHRHVWRFLFHPYGRHVCPLGQRKGAQIRHGADPSI